jgi:hypothetical protein
MSSQSSTPQRQRDPLFFSIEQQTSDFFFEQFDCSAERWLRYTTALGRTHKITLFTEGEKIPNLMHLHDTPPKAAHLRCVVPVTGTIAPTCTGAVPNITKIGYLSDDYTDKKYLSRSASQAKLDFPPRHDFRFTPKADMCGATSQGRGTD